MNCPRTGPGLSPRSSLSNAPVRYAGFAVIDLQTRSDHEMKMLATRGSPKAFEVDVVCVEQFGALALDVYAALEGIRGSV